MSRVLRMIPAQAPRPIIQREAAGGRRMRAEKTQSPHNLARGVPERPVGTPPAERTRRVARRDQPPKALAERTIT